MKADRPLLYYFFPVLALLLCACALSPERSPHGENDQSHTFKADQKKRPAEDVKGGKGPEEKLARLIGELRFVKGGCYEMGDTFKDAGPYEQPVHKVCVDDFFIGETEVTQRQWTEIMGVNPSTYKDCDECPVERVSWDDTHDFFRKLHKMTGMTFRLPTEAEWEYACRERGKRVRFGTGKNMIGSAEANFDAREYYLKPYSRVGVYRARTVPVRSFPPNALQLYEMSGNVWEWVQDTYNKDAYQEHEMKNPVHESPDSNYRVVRGGGFRHAPANMRCSKRSSISRDFRWRYIGFRIAKTK